MAGTLGPASDWLKSIGDPERNPYLAHLHNNIPGEAGALIGATVATPGLQDDLTIGAVVGTAFIAYHTITYFGKKDHRPVEWQPPERRTRNVPQKRQYERVQHGQDPREPRDEDEDKLVKGLTDVLGSIMQSKRVSLGAKVITGILSILYARRILTGEKGAEDNRPQLELAQTQVAGVPTPSYPRTILTTPVPPSGTSQISIPQPTPGSTTQPTATDTGFPSPTTTPTAVEIEKEKEYPPGMMKE
jgi:hypothetical protein